MAFKMKYGKHKGFPFRTNDPNKQAGQEKLTEEELQELRERSLSKQLGNM